MTTPRTISADSHLARIDDIRDGAIVARLVGIAAMHRRLPDGQHEITHHGRIWIAATLAEAIEAATGRDTR